jgi:uncharacterized protein with HEPN domain
MRHMLDHAREARSMAGARERGDLETDRQLCLSLTWLVGMVGEAAAHVPADTRSRWPGIPWRAIVGMRHRLIHGYDVTDPDLLRDTAVLHLPPLMAELERILAAEEHP